jgi:hypothetical protein
MKLLSPLLLTIFSLTTIQAMNTTSEKVKLLQGCYQKKHQQGQQANRKHNITGIS